ncbi:MAG: Uma2 family endonuclease [Chloroflexota bacterium]|nr:Uma2 family endonuclease [Chloroflexota bacterium]
MIRLVAPDGEVIGDSAALQGLWTTELYLRLTNNSNRLFEFTDGSLEVLPMPTKRHQAISKFLLFVLSAFLDPRGGTVFYSPLRLRIREGKFREPDLMAARDANDARLQNAYWLGADLVVEVVSEDDPQRDIITKRADYAEGGIPEYWIVNPLDETITVLKLEGAQYTEHGVFRRGDRARSALMEGLVVGVDGVFDAH